MFLHNKEFQNVISLSTNFMPQKAQFRLFVDFQRTHEMLTLKVKIQLSLS